MGEVSLKLYLTQVVNGHADGDSQETILILNDADGDGAISREEWEAYTESSPGHLAGATTPPALFLGEDTGRVRDGKLYTTEKFEDGEDITSFLDSLRKSNYAPEVKDLNICYLAGTLIQTPAGEVPVESLKAGDLVETVDHGPVQVVWTGQSHVDAAMLDTAPNRRLVRIEAGAFGDGLPRRTTHVSAQHRVVVKDGAGREVMVSAIHLVRAGAEGFSIASDLNDFTLVHIACARHEVLLAEGAPMESFHTGPMAIHALSAEQQAELMALFPGLLLGQNPMQPARPFLTWKEYLRSHQATTDVAH